MAITQQQTGVGTLAYPFYVADFDADRFTAPVTPPGTDATLFVLETRQTYVWRNGAWAPFDDRQAAALAALRQSVDAAPYRIGLLMLRELRRVAILLAQQQGAAPIFEAIPELDGLNTP